MNTIPIVLLEVIRQSTAFAEECSGAAAIFPMNAMRGRTESERMIILISQVTQWEHHFIVSIVSSLGGVTDIRRLFDCYTSPHIPTHILAGELDWVSLVFHGGAQTDCFIVDSERLSNAVWSDIRVRKNRPAARITAVKPIAHLGELPSRSYRNARTVLKFFIRRPAREVWWQQKSSAETAFSSKPLRVHSLASQKWT